MNPLIEHQGVCDPHIHIFEGKAYLYATHDNYRKLGEGFQMTEWQIWSSEDLVHWKLERIENPRAYYCGPIDQCWAVDAAYRDGKYYWYFSEGAKAVGVGVSDSPAGPFREALGHYLVGPDTPPVNVSKWDPCVFVDDDGEAYLICGSTFGTDEYLIARLNPDMCSLAEPLREIEYQGIVNREDKASIHKENGIYYLTHASFYATSDNVYGPYVYRGNTGANVDHGSFFTYHGQTYQASGGLDNPSQYYRASFLGYCHYRENGEIVTDQVPIGYGVGQYDAGWRRIEAEWFFACHQAKKLELPGGGFGVGRLTAGSWLHFPNVNHLEENASVTLCYANAGEDGRLEIREGSLEGALLGHWVLTGSRSEETYETVTVKLTNRPGPHSLFFVVKKGELALDWFAFDREKNHSNGEAARGVLLGRAETVEWPAVGGSNEGEVGAVGVNGGEAAVCADAANGLAVRLAHAGDGVKLFLDGGPGGSCRWTLRYQADTAETEAEPSLPAGSERPETGVVLACRINGGAAAPIELPGTRTGMAELSLPYHMEPGINTVELSLEENSAALLLDSLRVERAGSRCRSYAAGDGIVEPMGNGIWDGLPQRESDRYAYSGRCVCHLEQSGHRITIPGVDGGETGGKVKLLIRYVNGGNKAVQVRLKVNGIWGELVILPPTGGVRMEQASIQAEQANMRMEQAGIQTERANMRMEQFGVAETELELKPGDNRLVLMMTEAAEPGICIDAVTVAE